MWVVVVAIVAVVIVIVAVVLRGWFGVSYLESLLVGSRERGFIK